MFRNDQARQKTSGTRRLRRTVSLLAAVLGFATTTVLSGAAVATTAGAVVPHATGSCNFTFGSQSGSGTFASPKLLTGLNNGSTVHASCTGLAVGDSVAIIETSPLAVVTQPFNLTVLGNEADIANGLNNGAGKVAGNGTFSGQLNVGTTAGGGFTAGDPSLSFPGDPNAQCPPTQAQINAGLVTCLLTVADITATTAPGATASQADFAGEALLDFNGQAKPQVPPNVNFDPPVVAAGHHATVTDAGSAAHWWAGGWWAGGFPGGGLTPSPYNIPAKNVLVNGKVATTASLQVDPALYCYYGKASAASCNQSGSFAGALIPSRLTGSVAIPASASGSQASVQAFEPNVWGSAFPGNNSSDTAFPANDLTGSGNVGLTHMGYWEVASDGGLFAFGAAGFYGSMGGKPLAAPVVAMATTQIGAGYWEVASDGGLFAFGNAKFYGSMGGKPLARPVVTMVTTPDTKGYWEVASDGGLFAFGDAKFYGSMGGKPLNSPIVSMAATPDGKGYWEVAADGGLFAFGDAHFYGSMGGKPLNSPIVSMAATSDGKGYWEVAADGGLFSFGDAHFYGSMGGKPLNAPIVSMQATHDGKGYWEVASDGGLFCFGDAPFLGSMGGHPLAEPVVGLVAVPVLPTSSLTLAETDVNPSPGYGSAGDTISLNYTVTNTGQTALTNIAVTDSKVTVSCPESTLAAGDFEVCTATYTITQNDVDTDSVTFTSGASAVSPYDLPVSSSSATLTELASSRTSTIEIDASSPTSGFNAALDTVSYQYDVTNTGTTTLTGVAATDAVTNPNGGGPTDLTVACPMDTLAPGADETCTASYTITQGDVDSGQATNTGVPEVDDSASVSAQDPSGATITNDSAPVVVYGPDSGTCASCIGISLVATPSVSSYSSGTTIDYSYTVTNTGTITLQNISVTDSVGTPSCSSTTLAPGGFETCTDSYQATATDVSNGSIPNTVTATGYDVNEGNQVIAVQDATVTAT